MKRHSRTAIFEQTHRDMRDNRTTATGWTQIHDDPNHPRVVAYRAQTLAQAWREPIHDRICFLEDRVRAKNVLDVGCVAHSTERLTSEKWLHRRIANAAEHCLGVDLLVDGVETMRSAGYDAIVHDLSTGLGPAAAHGPFDVIVAGELIEHVTNLNMLFRTAANGLTLGGELILTTPNPYSPQRVRAGQQGIIWENVDHVSYLFPSGIAELAERNGLVLLEAATTEPRRSRPGTALQKLKRTIRGSHWRNVGFASAKDGLPTPVEPGPVRRALGRVARPAPQFIGETFVYVIGRQRL